MFGHVGRVTITFGYVCDNARVIKPITHTANNIPATQELQADRQLVSLPATQEFQADRHAQSAFKAGV